MTRIGSLFAVFVAWIAALGCDRAPQQNAKPPVSASSFAARLEAAKEIQNSDEHDQAMAAIAVDAAKAGDGEAAKSAVQGISSSELYDQAAADAAMQLAQDGYSAEAVEIAKLISSVELRDKTMAAIAKGG